MNDQKLLYSETINGFSYNTFYVRHFGIRDDAFIERYYKEFYQEALSQGLTDEKSGLQFNIENKIWTKEDEYSEGLERIKSMNLALSFLRNKTEIDANKAEIESEQAKVDELFSERTYLLGTTAESFASKKVIGIYLYLALYQDDSLNKRVLSFDTIDSLPEIDFNNYVDIYNTTLQKFNANTFRDLGFSSKVLNHIFLAENSMEFYGKAVVDLTHYQMDLYSWANYYKSIVKQYGQPPEEIVDNATDIIAWAESLKKNENAPKDNWEDNHDFMNELQSKGSVDFNQIVNSHKGLNGKRIHKW